VLCFVVWSPLGRNSVLHSTTGILLEKVNDKSGLQDTLEIVMEVCGGPNKLVPLASRIMTRCRFTLQRILCKLP
jgi:hypothetical protein